MLKSGNNPIEIVEKKGLKQISDPKKLIPIIKSIINNNQENVIKYKNGNQKLFGFFVGEVLKATNAKANPKIVNELIRKYLSK